MNTNLIIVNRNVIQIHDLMRKEWQHLQFIVV